MLLVLTPQSMFNELPRLLVVWGTFAITLVLGLIGYAAAKEAGLNPWTTPVALNAVYYFIRYGWGTVATEYWEDYPWETNPLLRMNFHRFGVWENLPGGCHLILVFGMGFMMGSVLAMRRRTLLPRFQWPLSPARLQMMLMLYAPFAIFINSYLQFHLPLSIRYLVTIFGSFVYPTTVLASYWLFSARESKERMRWGLFLGFIVLASIPVGLMSGQMAHMMLPMLMAVLGYIVARGTIPWKAIVLGAPVLFFVILPFAGIYKAAGAHIEKMDNRLEFSLWKYRVSSYRALAELSLERTVMRFAGSNMPSVFSWFYPKVYPFEAGKTMQIEASMMVPRSMWEDKGYGAFDLNRYTAKVGMVEYEGNTTALFDAVSEYYINFGLAGCFVLSIVHGYYWQAMFRWLTPRVHVLLGTVIVLVLLSQNEDLVGLGLLSAVHLKVIPVWLLLFYFFSRSNKHAIAT